MAHLFGQHHLGHYRKPVLNSLDRWLLRLQEPFCAFFNLFVCSFFQTTLEANHISVWTNKILAGVLWLLLTGLSLPLFITSFPIWCALQRFRTLPFKYMSRGGKRCDAGFSSDEGHRNKQTTFTIGSANLCLVPEFLLRWNNQMHNESKAHRIGCKIVESQREVIGNGCSDASSRSSRPNEVEEKEGELSHEITEVFPAGMDILCVQEAFHLRSTEALVDQLSTVYPYIIYDTGINSAKSNAFMTNSGLLIASKYPVIAASFYLFPQSAHYAYATSTGLLLAKINLGVDKTGVRQVALVGSTHLQAYQGVSNIHAQQLECMRRWCRHFRREYFPAGDDGAQAGCAGGERLVFDVVCGDFNLDNLSPVDEHVWGDDIFTGGMYTDPCMVRPGTDHHWTVGTEFRSHHLHSPDVSSPVSLRRTLSDARLRRRHLLDGCMESIHFGCATVDAPQDRWGQTVPHPAGGRRRIDRVLLSTRGTASPPVAEKFYFITQLAALTDHIPVALTFSTL